jgi:hypothetical protein
MQIVEHHPSGEAARNRCRQNFDTQSIGYLRTRQACELRQKDENYL